MSKPRKCCFDGCPHDAVQRMQYRDYRGQIYAVRWYCNKHSNQA